MQVTYMIPKQIAEKIKDIIKLVKDSYIGDYSSQKRLPLILSGKSGKNSWGIDSKEGNYDESPSFCVLPEALPAPRSSKSRHLANNISVSRHNSIDKSDLTTINSSTTIPQFPVFEMTTWDGRTIVSINPKDF